MCETLKEYSDRGPDPVRVEQQAFCLPKAGNSAEDYEDAFYKPVTTLPRHRAHRFAVADGATETSYSGIWAELLVNAYGEGTIDDRLDAKDLEPLRRQWKARVGDKPMTWYAEEKARLGAYSSLLGLRLFKDGPLLKWFAVAVGDSCVFQLRAGRLVTAFPLKHSADFNSRPALLSSNSGEGPLVRCSGRWKERDIFFLMTDALGCWFLRSIEEESRPWETLLDLRAGDTGPQSFAQLVHELRSTGQLRNDDVTLLRIRSKG
jgi:hypothetical protein